MKNKSWLFLDFLNVDLEDDEKIKKFLKRCESYEEFFYPSELVVSIYLTMTLLNSPDIRLKGKDATVTEFILSHKEKLLDLQLALKLYVSENAGQSSMVDEFKKNASKHWLHYGMGVPKYTGIYLQLKKLIEEQEGKEPKYEYLANIFDLIVHNVADYKRTFDTYLLCSYCGQWIISPTKTQVSNSKKDLNQIKEEVRRYTSNYVYCCTNCSIEGRKQRRAEKRK
ncbi:hypothetical protein ABC255_16440 [Neobacillus sp. 3P2-tot-E-2]|uniref:hypothetical protein n=1 Tax=Neobacillus sp. 3P2-tot-E-2 TaxID=3132212 RepID=UPI0039A37BAA